LKILLTGATGFIGSNFARLATSRGHKVSALVRPSSAVPPDLKIDRITGELGSIGAKELAGCGADVCVHAAWITTPGVYLESPENLRFRDESVQFLRRAVEAGVKHAMVLGTCLEYGPGTKPLSGETSPIVPTTAYAKCKNELRLSLEAEAKLKNFSFCWARVFYAFGPDEHPSKLISSIIGKLECGEKIVLKTPQSRKDYIYIDDLAAALLTLVEKRTTGIINLGTGTGTSVREIAHTVGKMMDRDALVEEANPPQPDPQGDVVADARKLQGLGWQPQTTLREGIAKMLEQKKR
jgi:nucleoside-diphosphate-sugar epimerase